jgi:hypothetical protein
VPSVSAEPGQEEGSWLEDALVEGWGDRWAVSPLLWRPRPGVRWGRLSWRLGLILSALALGEVVWAFLHGLAADLSGVRQFLQDNFLQILFLVTVVVVLLAYAIPLLLLAIVARLLRRAKGGRRGDRTYGTAQWHPLRREWWDPEQAVAAALVLRPNNPAAREGLIPWTIEDATFVHFTWAQLSRHMLVVGSTGSGKTTSLYHHLMLSARVPWIYQDQKAELPLADRFPERPIWGLDTRGYRSRSGVWNPMEEVAGPEDIEVMSALLFPDKGNMNDWIAHGARMLFEAMCKRWRFGSLQEYVYLIEHTPLDRIIAELPAGYATALADARSRAYYVSEILDVLRPWINTARIAAVTYGRSTVTLDDFIDRGGYVLCNEDKHLRQPVTLFWGMLLHRLRNRSGMDASPLLLLLDEFGDAGRIPNMAQALAMYRAKGVAIVAGIQSYALMESVYGATEWRAVRDGFGTSVILTANITPQLQLELTEQLGSFTMHHPQGSAGIGGPYPSIHVGIAAPSRVASPLVPLDQWAQWSQARAAIVRGAAGPTWWISWPVSIVPNPAAERLVEDSGQDWRLSEALRIAALGEAARGVLPGGSSTRTASTAITIAPNVERTPFP